MSDERYKRGNVCVCVCVCVTWLSAALVSPDARGQEPAWCDTVVTKGPCPPDCPQPTSVCEFGACDFPAMRDSWIPGPSAQDIKIRVKFNIFPSNLVVTPAMVAAELFDINTDFMASDIEFIETGREWINDPQFNVLETTAESIPMKQAHADQPAAQLNIYVTDIGVVGLRGFSTFPWFGAATNPEGGIVIDKDFFGQSVLGNPQADERMGVLTHEIGHALGLWHTFHGSSKSELESSDHGDCGTGPNPNGCDCFCYEAANRSTADGDSKGDMCSDTPATVVKEQCVGPIGNDACSNTPWNAAIDTNHMRVKSDASCRTKFEEQQKGRMQCWSCDMLTGWMIDAPVGACCLPNGSCATMTPTCCSNGGGSFDALGECRGDCDGDDADDFCVVPPGANACCLSDGTCPETTQACCAAQAPSLFCNGCSNGCATSWLVCPAIE